MTDFFQRWKVFLINLPERRDRLKGVKEELSRIGWDIGEPGVSLYSATKFSDRAGFPGPGVRGAFHSHSECLRAALRAGDRDVLLLEDDIAFASCFPRVLPALDAELRDLSWDFCY